MADTRQKDGSWQIHMTPDGVAAKTIENAMLAVLMDIRDE